MKTSSVEAKVEYLRPSTLYRFRVMAWNSLGPSSHPAQVSIQTLTQGKNNNTCYSEIIVINLKSGGERQCGSRGTNHTNYIKYISDNYTVWWEESEECHRIVCLHSSQTDILSIRSPEMTAQRTYMLQSSLHPAYERGTAKVQTNGRAISWRRFLGRRVTRAENWSPFSDSDETPTFKKVSIGCKILDVVCSDETPIPCENH